MQLRFAGHWLAFLWVVSNPGELMRAVELAKSAGATVFELIYHALNELSAKDTATALKAGGITRASMCIFYPEAADGTTPMGDPLGEEDDFIKAVTTFRITLKFIDDLRSNGIDIDLIVGPNCFVLGKHYNMSWAEKKQRIMEFYVALHHDCLAIPVKIAIELLRDGEDHVIETVENWRELIDDLNYGLGINRFGAHWDSVHMKWRGIDPVASIKFIGRQILHLHVNGDDRRPAGGDGDTMDWVAIIAALENEGLNNLTATNEPFCQLVRDNCPPLGVGLPPAVSEPGGMITTRETLQRCGVTFLE